MSLFDTLPDRLTTDLEAMSIRREEIDETEAKLTEAVRFLVCDLGRQSIDTPEERKKLAELIVALGILFTPSPFDYILKITREKAEELVLVLVDRAAANVEEFCATA